MTRTTTPLDSQGQVAKLETAMRLAEAAATSKDLATRLGALVLYAGIVDFFAIQAARLIEQIMLKGQLADGIAPKFLPHDDTYFYGRRISTGRILKGINKLLPFHATDENRRAEADRTTQLAKEMVARGLEFLESRNPLLHQIGSSSRSFDDVVFLVDQAIPRYHAFREAHTKFFESAGPYAFGPSELAHFYGATPQGPA